MLKFRIRSNKLLAAVKQTRMMAVRQGSYVNGQLSGQE